MSHIGIRTFLLVFLVNLDQSSAVNMQEPCLVLLSVPMLPHKNMLAWTLFILYSFVIHSLKILQVPIVFRICRITRMQQECHISPKIHITCIQHHIVKWHFSIPLQFTSAVVIYRTVRDLRAADPFVCPHFKSFLTVSWLEGTSSQAHTSLTNVSRFLPSHFTSLTFLAFTTCVSLKINSCLGFV